MASVWTLSDLLSRLSYWMDDSSNNDLTSVMTNALNDANTQRATEFDWSFMHASSAGSFTITTAKTYTLDAECQKPIWMYNVTKQQYLVAVPERHLRPDDVYSTNQNDVLQQRVILRGPSNTSTQTLTVQFLRQPTEGDIIVYDYIRKPTIMSVASDVPDIPFPFSQLLVWDALIMLKAYTLEPDAISIWQDNQQKILTSLYAKFGNPADMVSAEGEYVNYLKF